MTIWRGIYSLGASILAGLYSKQKMSQAAIQETGILARLDVLLKKCVPYYTFSITAPDFFLLRLEFFVQGTAVFTYSSSIHVPVPDGKYFSFIFLITKILSSSTRSRRRFHPRGGQLNNPLSQVSSLLAPPRPTIILTSLRFCRAEGSVVSRRNES